jgi:hypothetical protein
LSLTGCTTRNILNRNERIVAGMHPSRVVRRPFVRASEVRRLCLPRLILMSASFPRYVSASCSGSPASRERGTGRRRERARERPRPASPRSPCFASAAPVLLYCCTVQSLRVPYSFLLPPSPPPPFTQNEGNMVREPDLLPSSGRSRPTTCPCQPDGPGAWYHGFRACRPFRPGLPCRQFRLRTDGCW